MDIVKGILGIPNRTENWKTAKYFAPFFESAFARDRLVQCLLGPLAEIQKADLEPTRIELFWKGIRDYEHAKGEEKNNEVLGNCYRRSFRDLREKVEQFSELKDLKQDNYKINSKENLKKFCGNLRNTEIDIVLGTRGHLFIGETKDVSNFGAASDYVLVHQLIRQYVTAQILLDLTQSGKSIVPFLIVDKIDNVRKTAQVKFMINHGYLKAENILPWGKISEIARKAKTTP